MKKHILTVAALFFLCNAASGTYAMDKNAVTPQSTNLPRDVTAFLQKRATCNVLTAQLMQNLRGERTPATDALSQQLAERNCDSLGDDETALRQKYTSSPEVLQALNDPQAD